MGAFHRLEALRSGPGESSHRRRRGIRRHPRTCLTCLDTIPILRSIRNLQPRPSCIGAPSESYHKSQSSRPFPPYLQSSQTSPSFRPPSAFFSTAISPLVSFTPPSTSPALSSSFFPPFLPPTSECPKSLPGSIQSLTLCFSTFGSGNPPSALRSHSSTVSVSVSPPPPPPPPPPPLPTSFGTYVFKRAHCQLNPSTQTSSRRRRGGEPHKRNREDAARGRYEGHLSNLGAEGGEEFLGELGAAC
ncbi:hypothetical protein PMIN03_002772 [Paraphaeosphaeria minitans]